jgi:hypothetical protein
MQRWPLARWAQQVHDGIWKAEELLILKDYFFPRRFCILF